MPGTGHSTACGFFQRPLPLLEAWLLLFYVSSLVTHLWSFKVEKTPASL